MQEYHDDNETENEQLHSLISIKSASNQVDVSPSDESQVTFSVKQQSSLQICVSFTFLLLGCCLMLLCIGTNFMPIVHTISPFFQSAQLVDEPKQLTDPLPSCSLINVNLTHNLLHHQWTVQHPHANADCSYYTITGQCFYDTSGIGYSFDPSSDQPVPSSTQSFRPKWLVFRMRTGSGGLGDRMKGFLTILTLALLTGRAIAIDSEPTNPITITHSRSILDWRTLDSLPLSLQQSANRLDIDWSGHSGRPLFKDQTDWSKQWADHDIVTIAYNFNGFVDLMDNRLMYNRYRTFGFHSWSDKGDIDLYWECLMDFTFRYSPAVSQPLNELLRSINRKPLKSWQDIEHDVPTLSQLITLQANNAFILSNTTSAHRWDNYQSQFYYDQPDNPSSAPTASQHSSNQSHLLFCVQLRMGSHANFAAAPNQSSLSFTDTDGFLHVNQFPQIFAQMDERLKQTTLMSNNISLFLTGDSPEFESHIPASWRGFHRLVAPGRTGHIDRVTSADTALLHEAAINTVVTHFIIGECDIAAVTRSGFGPTAMWRSRNRHTRKPLKDAVYPNKIFINKGNNDLVPYHHMRGSVGRESEKEEYKPRQEHIITTGTSLFGEAIMKVLSSEYYGMFQASSQLPIEPPDDPMCTRFGFHR